MAILNENHWELIAKYMAPDCSKEDKQEAEKLAKENPEFESALGDSTSYWDAAPKLRPVFEIPDVDAQMAKMRAKMAASSQDQAKPTIFEAKERNGSGLGVWRWAAAVVVMIGATYLAMTYTGSKTDQPVTIASLAEGQAPTLLTFPDGSDITLKAGQIEWLSDDNAKIREIALHGEAFFEVKRDEAKPFIIKTNHAETQVLGTSFNIKEEENMTSIEVKTGKVSFKGINNGEELILKPGAAASFDGTSGELLLQKNGEYAAFKYQNVSLKMITDRLAKQYEQQFTFADDQLASIKVNLGAMEMAPAKWEENIMIISKAAKVKFEKSDTGYSIISLY